MDDKKKKKRRVGRPNKPRHLLGRAYSTWLYHEDEENLEFMVQFYAEARNDVFRRALGVAAAQARKEAARIDAKATKKKID